jgi:hypothetical protein
MHIQVSATISLLPADYVQLCHHCNHGGNNSRANCPTCLTLKSTRLDACDLNLSTFRRNKFFDAACAQQIILETGSAGQKQYDTIRKRYGCSTVSRGIPLLDSVGGDCANACFRDRSHLFYFGLFQDILEHTLLQRSVEAGTKTRYRINHVLNLRSRRGVRRTHTHTLSL